MMVLVILLGILVMFLGVIVFLQSTKIYSVMDLRKLENDEYAESIAILKQQLDAAQNAYLTLGRYIFENKGKLNDEED